MRRSAAALALCAAALGLGRAAPLWAQGAVAGVVTDSLRGGAPLAGATVQLVPAAGAGAAAAPRAATTDSAGGFRIGDVPAGTYLLGFLHPRVDQLGVELPVRQFTLSGAGPDVRVDLAVPGARRIAAAVCGAPPGDSAGVLLGRVRAADAEGAPAERGTVTVRWTELQVDARGVRRAVRALRARADDEGRFVVCGVPTDAPVLAEGTGGDATTGGPPSARSGEVELSVPAGGLLERDLLVSPPAAASAERARLAGRVRRPDGSPAAGARVRVAVEPAGAPVGGAPDGPPAAPEAVADARGAFVLDGLVPGTRAVEVRAVGFSPRRLAVDLVAGQTAAVEVAFAPPAQALERVTVYGTARRRGDLSGFVRRSQGGFGRFLTAEQLERTTAVQVTDLLRMMPGLRVEPTGMGGQSALYSRGQLNLSRRCQPAVFVDGVRAFDGANSLDQLVHPREIAGVEVYTDFASAPAEYQGGPCGSVVIWTRGAL